MKQDKLANLWTVLEKKTNNIPLKLAIKEAGLEWYTEGGGGNDDLVDFVLEMKKYQKKKIIKKFLRDKKYMNKFIKSDDFYHLYLLRKTKHTGIDMLFGADSTFSLLDWPKMYRDRRKLYTEEPW